jgi:CheY-like chemotaxis protein
LSYAGTIPDTIRTDPARLKQILINLIDNAVKFTEKGSISLILRLLGAEESYPMMQFDILDTGIGMAPEQVDHLFEPLTPAGGSVAHRFGGTGMGLSICRRLAELLGGEIVAESQPGKGSTLRLTITTGPLESRKPANQPATAPAITAAPASKLCTPEEPLRCRILLAEDGPDNQRLFSFILKKAGAQVDVADNGKIAVEKATAGEPYDVILMDIQMPLMDGYTATSRLRANRYNGTIIALTAHAMASDRQACFQAGCDDYATKPIDQRMLIAMIREHLRRDGVRA